MHYVVNGTTGGLDNYTKVKEMCMNIVILGV